MGYLSPTGTLTADPYCNFRWSRPLQIHLESTATCCRATRKLHWFAAGKSPRALRGRTSGPGPCSRASTGASPSSPAPSAEIVTSCSATALLGVWQDILGPLLQLLGRGHRLPRPAPGRRQPGLGPPAGLSRLLLGRHVRAGCSRDAVQGSVRVKTGRRRAFGALGARRAAHRPSITPKPRASADGANCRPIRTL